MNEDKKPLLNVSNIRKTETYVKVKQGLAHSQFFSMDRIVIDTEGRVEKPAAPGAPLPGNVLLFVLRSPWSGLIDLARSLRRSLRRTFRPEPLGCGDDQM